MNTVIGAAGAAAGGTLADQWLDFFYMDAMPETVIMRRAFRRVNEKSRNRGSDDVVSNGSRIAVADGQCMVIVDQGKVMDVCAEPGEYIYDQSSMPSIFAGNLGDSIVNTFKEMMKRFSFGGDIARVMRVYYFNTKELKNNKFGTATAIPFRVVDQNIGLDIDVSVRCNGMYSFRLTNPILFYTNVAANIEGDYTRDRIESQMKSEFLSALQPSFAKLSALGIRPSALPGETGRLSEALNEALSEKWGRLRGFSVVSIAINSVSLPPEDEEMIKQLQRQSVFRNANMAGAALVDAQADAMRLAAGNEGTGAMMGLMGMGMAQQTGGMNANQLFQMGQQQQMQQAQQMQAPPPAAGWTCDCGTSNAGNFCQNCAKPKPVAPAGWTCECGTSNAGNFCQNCAKPAPPTAWTCECSTSNTGNFCTNCAKPRG
ncbi:MAG: SPFH domain-containing protein [Defluviitaleaceae bacterium]|nr:SPFH domain-containing protein [Defluviitaleaceae bacterium]